MSTDLAAADDLIDRIQQAYPTLWFACHVAHRTRGEPHPSGLTDRESTVLAHLTTAGVELGALATHLGMSKSSLSVHLTRLQAMGVVQAAHASGDQRRKQFHLTEAGQRVRRAESPLDATRLALLLDELDAPARAAAVAGLEALAHAARRMMARQGAALDAPAGEETRA